jgi:HK97 family phage prohead protease
MQTATNTKFAVREAVLRALTPQQIENREAEFVISTEAVDTYRTVFKTSGWDLERYAKNPIVAYGHRTWDAEPDNIIGTSEVRIEDNMLIGKVRFEDAETNPKAEKIWKKVQAGTLRMASISANIHEWRYGDVTKGEDKEVVYFLRQELLEWSIVPIGSNPDAHVRNAKTIEEIRELLKPEQNNANQEGEQTAKLSVRKAKLMLNKNRF